MSEDVAMIDCFLSRFLFSTWFKLLVASGVITLLVYFNRVDATVLAGLIHTWPWLLASFALMLPTYLIVSYRFKLILYSQGIPSQSLQAIRWTMIGAFFDLTMPSSSGGDLVKAGYVAGHAGEGKRMSAVMAVAFDRMLGLLGLFLLASLAGCLGWIMLEDMPIKKWCLGLPVLISLGTLVFLCLVDSKRVMKKAADCRFAPQPAKRRCNQFLESFNHLREHPRLLFASLGLSIINHLFWCASLLCVIRVFGGMVDPLKGLIVFPLAIFGNIFGVAGGFGGGTAGFDFLFSLLLDTSNGAMIGFLFQTLSALTRLAGLPFYLLSPPGVDSDG